MKNTMKSSDGLFIKNSCNSVSAILADNELRAIIGGGGVPTDAQIAVLVNGLFSSIFTQDATLLANPTLLAEFKTEVASLASTATGYDMLTQLVSAGAKFQINGNSAPDGYGEKGTAEYIASPSRPVLYIGDLWSTPNGSVPSQKIANFGAVAHELYHAYQQLVQKQTPAYSKSMQSELDAGIFQFMADEEMDLKTSTPIINSSYVYNEDNFETSSPGSDPAATLKFRAAWYDMFANHNFTLDNYNALVQNFKTGTYSGRTPTYSVRTTISETTLNDLSIMSFYNNDFEKTKTPLLNIHLPASLTTPGANGGFGGSPGTGGNSVDGFFSWYDSMQNSGYHFYTSYSIDTTTGLEDMGLYAWVPGTTSVTIYSPTMNEWVAAYANGGGWSFAAGGFSGNAGNGYNIYNYNHSHS